MTIAVDFDGTIVEHRFPKIGKEIPFAIETLKKLSNDGHRLILWSAREGELLKEAVDFCSSRGLEFFAVNADRPESNWSEGQATRKIVADMYIDDRNLGGIPDWGTIYKMVAGHLTYADLISSDAGEDMELRSGTFRRPSQNSGRSRRKSSKRRGWFGRIVDRCREARRKYSR